MTDNKKDNAEKLKVLESTIKSLEKDYGKGILMRMDDSSKLDVESFSSGSINLDLALGVGGYPRGRIVEAYGPESSGKTTLALHAIAECQKAGGICAFIDAEHALDIAYARKIGVNVDELYVSQPNNGEQALQITEELVSSHALDLVVIDSVAALVPKAEIEGNMGDAQMALQARLMSQALRKLAGCVSRTKTTIFFINQLRMKIGVFFGSPETTTGGNALKFYASQRLDIRRIETLKKGEESFGIKVRVKVVKNKMAPPFKQAVFDIYYGEGISRFSEIMNIAVANDIIQKAGSWYSYNDERIGQGAENVKKFLKENPDIYEDIEKAVLKELGFGEQPKDSGEKTSADKQEPKAEEK